MATEETCVDALRQAAARLGEAPSKAEYEDLGLTPASATIQRVMGGWNEAKEAVGLETNSSTGSRVIEKPHDVELPAGTAWEELTVDQRWHYRNADWNTERTLRRRSENRAWLQQYKVTRGGCKQCDEQHPGSLDFHHRDDTDKEMSLNQMVSDGYSRKQLAAEIEKCDVLCANCHRKEHYEPPRGFKLEDILDGL